MNEWMNEFFALNQTVSTKAMILQYLTVDEYSSDQVLITFPLKENLVCCNIY